MMTDEPFQLANRPVYAQPARLKPPPDQQLTLFRGMGDSPGQRDFIEELESKGDDHAQATPR